MIFQKTLKSEISLEGIGLHSGDRVRVVIKPAHPNHGIVFVRKDLTGTPRILVHHRHVVSTMLATTLGSGAVRVGTVEHLLAALQGAGIDNALIEINGVEVPVLDGSAAPFYQAIRKVGIFTQRLPRACLALRKRVELRIAEKWAVAEPSAQLEVKATIEWDHPAIGFQEFHYVEGVTPFSEVASARTFGFLKDVENLKERGLARGGSLENVVVLDQASVLNKDGLRYADEFVRHKVLDALGDLKLAGIPVQGYIQLHRAGHDLHHQLLRTIFSDPDHYEIISFPAVEKRPPASVHAALARTLAASFQSM